MVEDRLGSKTGILRTPGGPSEAGPRSPADPAWYRGRRDAAGGDLPPVRRPLSAGRIRTAGAGPEPALSRARADVLGAGTEYLRRRRSHARNPFAASAF